MAEQFKSRPRRLKAGDSALAQLLGLSGTSLSLEAQRRNQGIPPMAQPESAPVRSFLPQDQQAALQSYADRTFTQSNIETLYGKPRPPSPSAEPPPQQPPQQPPPQQKPVLVSIADVAKSKYLNVEGDPDVKIEGEWFFSVDPQTYSSSIINAYTSGDVTEYNRLLKQSKDNPGLHSRIKAAAKEYTAESAAVTAGLNKQVIEAVNQMSEGELKEKHAEASNRFYEVDILDIEGREQPEDLGELRKELASIYLAETFDMPSPLDYEEIRSNDDYNFIKTEFLETDDSNKLKPLKGPTKDPRVIVEKLGWTVQDMDKLPSEKQKDHYIGGGPAGGMKRANQKLQAGLDKDKPLRSEGDLLRQQQEDNKLAAAEIKYAQEAALKKDDAQKQDEKLQAADRTLGYTQKLKEQSGALSLPSRAEVDAAARVIALQQKAGRPQRSAFATDAPGAAKYEAAVKKWMHQPESWESSVSPSVPEPLKAVYKNTEQAAPPIDPAQFKFDINTKEGRTKLQQMLVSQGINLKGTTKEAGVIQQDPSKALMPTKGVGRAGPRTKAGTKAIQQQLGVSPTGEWNEESAVALARKLSAEQDPISGVSNVPSLPEELSFAQAPKSIKQPEFEPTDPKSKGTAKGEGGFFDKPGAKELAITGGLMGAEAFRYLMGTLGPAATYARKRIDQLEAEETDDFRDRALERQERKEGMAAIRGLGESTLREQEKAQAMQPRTSAARLQRMREGAQRELYRASLGLEKDVQARKGARAMQKQRELESLYQYEQQRRDAALGRLTAGASQLAGQYGKITAAGAQLREYDPIKWAEKFQAAGWSKEDALKQAMEMVKIGAKTQSYEQAMELIKAGTPITDPRFADLGLSQAQKSMKSLTGLK